MVKKRKILNEQLGFTVEVEPKFHLKRRDQSLQQNFYFYPLTSLELLRLLVCLNKMAMNE